MNDDTTTPDTGGDAFLEAGVRYYLFMACAGLIAMWIVLTSKFGILALVPTLLGALGVAAYLVPQGWGVLSRNLRRPLYLMPVLALLSIMVFEVFLGYEPWGRSSGSLEMNDLLLCPALLAYLAGQYRLFSLGSAAVPPDTRPRPDRLAGDSPEPRPARLVTPRELARLGGVIVGCVVAGQLLWRYLITGWGTLAAADQPRLAMGHVTWRMALLLWLVGVGTLVLTGLFRVLRAYRQSGDAARMVLQDELWAETRGEQRRAARWLAWARRRAERQLEKQA